MIQSLTVLQRRCQAKNHFPPASIARFRPERPCEPMGFTENIGTGWPQSESCPAKDSHESLSDVRSTLRIYDGEAWSKVPESKVPCGQSCLGLKCHGRLAGLCQLQPFCRLLKSPLQIQAQWSALQIQSPRRSHGVPIEAEHFHGSLCFSNMQVGISGVCGTQEFTYPPEWAKGLG